MILISLPDGSDYQTDTLEGQTIGDLADRLAQGQVVVTKNGTRLTRTDPFPVLQPGDTLALAWNA